MKKAIAITVVVIAGGVLAWGIYQRLIDEGRTAGRRGGPLAVAVEIQPPTRRTMRDVAELTGTLLPENQFIVAPKVPGRLERLLVDIGDRIHHGDLVAVLDSEEYAQQVAQAGAELKVIRANLAEYRSDLQVARREYERARELREQKVASEAELDQAKARFDAAQARMEVAEAQIQQRQAALAAAEIRLGYTRIHATWTGAEGDASRVVARRFVDEGSMLRANDPIVSIVELDPVIAVINVIERDFPQIRIGQSATISTDAWPGQTFTGRIARVAPVLEEETRQGRVEVAVPNPGRRLAPGMFARVRIEFEAHLDATAVPAGALVRRNGVEGVFAVDLPSRTARFVPVKIGITEGNWVEIASPEPDAPIVTLGQHLLEDGGPVLIPPNGEDVVAEAQPATPTPTRPADGGGS